jgi:hypothetical protein
MYVVVADTGFGHASTPRRRATALWGINAIEHSRVDIALRNYYASSTSEMLQQSVHTAALKLIPAMEGTQKPTMGTVCTQLTPHKN